MSKITLCKNKYPNLKNNVSIKSFKKKEKKKEKFKRQDPIALPLREQLYINTVGKLTGL